MNEWEWQLLESQPSAPHIEIHGAAIVAGSRVRLCPHPGGDALDPALLADGVHPGDEGHRVLAAFFGEAVEAALNSSR